MSAVKVLLGALAGIAVGAALGVLFAPDKGTNTRKKISQKTADIKDNLEGRFNDIVDGVSERFETIKESASRMTDKARHNSQKAGKEAAASTN